MLDVAEGITNEVFRSEWAVHDRIMVWWRCIYSPVVPVVEEPIALNHKVCRKGNPYSHLIWYQPFGIDLSMSNSSVTIGCAIDSATLSSRSLTVSRPKLL